MGNSHTENISLAISMNADTLNLNGSDDGTQHSESRGLLTLSIMQKLYVL